ncbi:MAG TPA: cobalamin-binding protein, partial [Pyrinomonadaceae bacterium]|nr:cobalamin-binding protein [Pyrinomonadaceae bacterium]
ALFFLSDLMRRARLFDLGMKNEMRFDRAVFCIVTLFGLLLSGCGVRDFQGTRPGGTRTFGDDLGRKVVLPDRIERAVSLAPSLTEMIFAVGAGDRLVGDTTYCNYPPEAQRIEKVGDTQTPNIERIVALKPDVVFVSTASQLESFMNTLESQGISVYVSDPKDLDDVIVSLTRFGDLFGTTEHASSLAESLVARVEDVKQRVAGHKPVTVFLQISKEPLFTIGHDSFLTNIIETAGGKSVTAGVATAYPKLSKETAAALAPEVIVLSDSEDNPEPNEVFKNSPAVKNGRVYKINADIISRPGPRLVDALERVADFLQHPTNAM